MQKNLDPKSCSLLRSIFLRLGYEIFKKSLCSLTNLLIPTRCVQYCLRLFHLILSHFPHRFRLKSFNYLVSMIICYQFVINLYVNIIFIINQGELKIVLYLSYSNITLILFLIFCNLFFNFSNS